jgi:uncharacterized protein involved in copper resistance
MVTALRGGGTSSPVCAKTSAKAVADFAAIGVMGLAPYKFDVEATAYIGESGQTAARFQAEYNTLLTNRLILQWLAEVELYGKDDAPAASARVSVRSRQDYDCAMSSPASLRRT